MKHSQTRRHDKNRGTGWKGRGEAGNETRGETSLNTINVSGMGGKEGEEGDEEEEDGEEGEEAAEEEKGKTRA